MTDNNTTMETPLSADGPQVNIQVYAITILALVAVSGIFTGILCCYYRYRIKHVTPLEAQERNRQRARHNLGYA